MTEIVVADIGGTHAARHRRGELLMAKPPKLRGDGELDGRGHSEGWVPTRFAASNGRKRPG